MTPCNQPFWLTLSVIAVSFGVTATVAQEQPKRLLPAKITIDEDILAAFVDEPCHHFESARDRFVAGDGRTAANELRTAAAFLKLEAVRSTPDGKAILETSIAELGKLAVSVQSNRVKSVKVLKQAFARAHYALASHHCVKSAHRCCRPTTFQNKQESVRAGRDLKAATFHFNQGSRWAGDKPDEETRKLFESARLTADQLIRRRSNSQNEVQRTIHAVHGKLEKITGLKIMLAPPLALKDDKRSPSIFR